MLKIEILQFKCLHCGTTYNSIVWDTKCPICRSTEKIKQQYNENSTNRWRHNSIQSSNIRW